MRTNVDIDDALLAEAMAESGLKTKKATLEQGLRELIAERRARRSLKALWGIGWDGDLDEMRNNWWKDDPAS